MIVLSLAEMRELWRVQGCDDTSITGLEHARFSLSIHAGHGCLQYSAATSRASEPLQ